LSSFFNLAAPAPNIAIKDRRLSKTKKHAIIMPSLASKVVSMMMALVFVTTTAIDRHHLFAASAFSTPGRHHRRHHHSHNRLSRPPPSSSTNDIAHHPTTTRRFVARHQQQTTTTTREDFQRSLLEAKIANDVKNTIMKDEQQRNIIVSCAIAQERVELQDAVNEVRDAMQDLITIGQQQDGSVMDAAVGVSKSAINLGGAFVTTVPKIFTRLFTLCATSETR